MLSVLPDEPPLVGCERSALGLKLLLEATLHLEKGTSLAKVRVRMRFVVRSWMGEGSTLGRGTDHRDRSQGQITADHRAAADKG